ncbi:MAG: hypothetical protein ABW166_19355 [Sedimenticola sp.]
MKKTIKLRLCKAQPEEGFELPDLHIKIDEIIDVIVGTSELPVEELEHIIFKTDAINLCTALTTWLPLGTLDALLIELLERRASSLGEAENVTEIKNDTKISH